MAAEVASSPSQPSVSGDGAPMPGIGHSSQSQTPFSFNLSTPASTAAGAQPSLLQNSTSVSDSSAHMQLRYKSAASPSDDVSSSYFLNHQQQQPQQQQRRLSPVGILPNSVAVDRSVPRGLSSMMVESSPSGRMSFGSQNDQRQQQQPLSPTSVAMSINNDNQDSLSGSATAPRKRSKVSRACDECRRKKIRCDASSESGIEQCSSCKRVGSKCSFSRVPMKRGPSKGYIKELADRLNTLENSISTGDIYSYGLPGEGGSPGPSDSTSPPPLALGPQKHPRKRTLSSSSDYQSGVHLQPLSQSNSVPRQSERLPSIDSFHPSNQQRSQLLQHEPQRQLPPPQTTGHDQTPQAPSKSGPDVSQVNYSLSPDGTRNYWKGFTDSPRGDYSYDIEPQRPPTNSPGGDAKTFEWDEESIDQYYSLIHPTFPLLPHSKSRLRQRLAMASSIVREALLEALYAAVRNNPSSATRANSSPVNPRRACELCMASQFESQDPRAGSSGGLLFLQTVILMALEADNHGPAANEGQLGPPRAVWVGSAVGLAYNLKLHHNKVGESFAHGDPDSDEKLGRRAWWVLVVLDRWHAISTSSPSFIPDTNVVLLPEDQMLIGLTPFHLVRLSCILGHLAEAFTTADEVVSNASLNPYICRLLRGELERFRESVEVVWGSLGLLHVAYYHVKLLTLRHNSSTEPRQLLEPALRIATILDHSSMPITPLNHHFAALALITLIDLAEVDETRTEAWEGIQQLSEALRKRRGLAIREDSVGWDRAIKDLINKRVERGIGSGEPPRLSGHGNLQHLAELAIGDRSPPGRGSRAYSSSSTTATAEGVQRSPTQGLDTGKLQKYGYLGLILL